MYTTDDFDFHLPEQLIAQTPLAQRSSSRLLLLNRQTGTFQDAQFPALINQLNPGDALVINDTRVLPARLHGQKVDTNAHIEVLLLHNREQDDWDVLIKPAKRAKVGTVHQFGDHLLTATVIAEGAHGERVITFSYKGVFLEILDQLGDMPLPPYIKEKLSDKERYQTVYAKENGSAAAPTAGLHFTPELLQQIKDKGVHVVPITLHVGLGTFRPVSVSDLSQHKMHAEQYIFTEAAARTLNEVKQSGNRIVAVGTTSVRTLETLGQKFRNQPLAADCGWTDIFITPGYQFQLVDAFLTNFHLPKSTLVMLVSAFAGRDTVLAAYQHAIEEQYRFFSFGDAMFVS